MLSRKASRGHAPALIALALALLSAPCSALAASPNAASTGAYLRADYRMVRAGVSSIPRVQAALQGVLAGVRRECPLAAAGSPQDAQSTELSDEVIGALVTAVFAQNRSAASAFAAAATGLRWSEAALTQTIRSYVQKVSTLLALPSPNLCGDVRAWAASGFRTLPAGTLAFAPRFMSAWVALGELPPRIARYVAASQRPLLATTLALEERFLSLESREVETYNETMNALALWP